MRDEFTVPIGTPVIAFLLCVLVLIALVVSYPVERPRVIAVWPDGRALLPDGRMTGPGFATMDDLAWASMREDGQR